MCEKRGLFCCSNILWRRCGFSLPVWALSRSQSVATWIMKRNPFSQSPQAENKEKGVWQHNYQDLSYLHVRRWISLWLGCFSACRTLSQIAFSNPNLVLDRSNAWIMHQHSTRTYICICECVTTMMKALLPVEESDLLLSLRILTFVTWHKIHFQAQSMRGKKAPFLPSFLLICVWSFATSHLLAGSTYCRHLRSRTSLDQSISSPQLVMAEKKDRSWLDRDPTRSEKEAFSSCF